MNPELPLNIMIVEDNRLIAFAFAMDLEKLGHHVKTIHSAKAASDYASHHPIDLIFMDIHLNDATDGIECIKKIHKEQGFIPHVYISGYTNDEFLERAQETAPVMILDKPFNIDKVKNLLSQKLQV